MDKNEQQYLTSEDWKVLKAKLKQANGGDQEAISWLRRFLDKHPQIWQYIGDLSVISENAWISLISNDDALAAESIRRQLNTLKAELMEESTTAMEKLLVDSILATWLEIHYLRSVDAGSRSRTVTQASLLTKRLESAQRRHHSAMKDLLMFRKLMPNRGALPELRVFRGRQTA
ncbi:hypothetical protein C5Y96_03135 [Blastopirellula marina]|uniref:Uncharacterized protein n=1 Tax=Blastopirellula marina TaxID=124 RepID=A0A2S8G3K9_9BACT|nr:MULTISPECIES: hypothetical protein [Pirellulaceae]PQO38880.1 hypothetical protein C5Y96_03135 [Blastopirellula marina]RCS55188.1 hypothetical protein DTL36_03140 [Bremerella cremea]